MNLSLIVPVCDDLDGARTVVRQAFDLGIFSEIILSDDASERPFELADLIDPVGGADSCTDSGASPGVNPGVNPGAVPDVRILRQDTRGGAGRARNRALAEVTGSHVLFFDADDHLRSGLARLWQRLKAETLPFDFCMFQHVEERRDVAERPGMFPRDEALWREAGACHTLAPLDLAAAPRLAQVAAYPWNKIYRTAFLRDHGVRCSETLVHNDIALHWLGFLKADRVLCSTVLGCDHVLGQARNHLTNRRGRARLQVLEALRDVLAQAGPLTGAWAVSYACFYIDLLTWARDRVGGEYLAEFDRLAQEFTQGQMTPDLFSKINYHNPDLGRHCLDLMMGGPSGRG